MKQRVEETNFEFEYLCLKFSDSHQFWSADRPGPTLQGDQILLKTINWLKSYEALNFVQMRIFISVLPSIVGIQTMAIPWRSIGALINQVS